MAERPFGPDVVAAVTGHVNEDHADACLDIVRGLGHVRDATEACLDDVDAEGATFNALVDGRLVTVRVPWSRTIAERADIRTEIVAMHERATAALAAR
jgi:hypothetical protein